MSARQDPTRREELLLMLRSGGASHFETAARAVDLAITEALAEQAAELESYERLSPQQCPKGIHSDWLIDSEYAHACPWCRIAELEAERDAHRKASGCTCIDGPELDAGQLLHSSYCATVIGLLPSVPQQRGESR
ncbi:hypothetical protein ACFVZH_02425 [Streptomyces sp. NPDC059534]|uniref:hypothetical protein n=1 Tax=Streptomyces sp. NPDC059534 TaxID=3346859 RepID=UPI0036CA48E1